jgi:hypothetical protein
MNRQFTVLFREFFDQFFASESATSDEQHRQVIISVLAFIITPGLLLPFQMTGQFEFAAIRFPAMLEPLTERIASIFIGYAMVSIGMVAVFVWDSLTFDRRDAMVIGPLPVGGPTIVLAKLAALAAFLLAASAAANAVTALPFASIASSHKPLLMVGRHALAHMVATMAAATFVFSALVTLRSLIALANMRSIVLPTVLQFVLFTALLCFILLSQTTIHVDRVRIGESGGVHLMPIPAWSPTNWFLGVYEVLRGSARPGFTLHVGRAIWFTLGAVAAAVLSTLAAYRRQFQLALAPSARTQSARSAWMLRAFARAFCGSDPVARATAGFTIDTIIRSRAQQVPVAINAAIGMTLLVIVGSRLLGSPTDVAANALLRAALLLGYWTIIGLRASFFVPAELKAAWTFNVNAPVSSRAYWAAARAAMLAMVVAPAALVVLTGIGLLRDWQTAFWQAAIVTIILTTLVDVVAATISHVPFTQAYIPGHSKLKSTWPIYAFGVWVFVFWPVHMPMWSPGEVSPWAAGPVIVFAIAAHVVSQRRAARWRVAPPLESNELESEVTRLDISFAEPQSKSAL